MPYSECHPEELKTACDSLGGRIWNRDYCILDDYYTVVGPVCWRSACFASTENDCAALGGTSVAKWWCLLKGCDYTGASRRSSEGNFEILIMRWVISLVFIALVIGPTCSLIPENIQEQCFEVSS